MKKLVAVIVALVAPFAFADEEMVLDSKIQVDEYTASVGGPAGCKMPADLRNPKEGECEVKKGHLETGWKLVKVGDQCYRDEIKLVEFKKFKALGGWAIDLPQTTSSRSAAKCPS